MKHIYFLLLCFGFAYALSAQSPTCYRIYLSDKKNSPYSVNYPSQYLSQRAIEKRIRFKIPITEQDLPINPQYKELILALHPQIQQLAVSKWMNTFTVYCPDSTVLPQILNLPFVDSIIAVAAYQLYDNPVTRTDENPIPLIHNVMDYTSKNDEDYGEGFIQIAMHNGHLLHEAGFRGEGMLIAVIDAGWGSFEELPFYTDLIDNGRYLGKYSLMPNFIDTLEGLEGSHGTAVTSIMAANETGRLIGTAPASSYVFIVSENGYSEQLVEEDFWANAAEIADSIGADVVNSSLYYCDFRDFPQANFSYSELDGQHSVASLCATILGEKGVVVCVIAGNTGPQHIGHPADAFNILCVGSCTPDSIYAFSSQGYTVDGRVKPDVTAIGQFTACYSPRPGYPSNGVFMEGGTSFACPIIAGLSACLWQALPNYSSSEIMQIIRESGHLYNNPNPQLGYGIPDFYKAYTSHTSSINEKPLQLNVYPNPVSDKLHLINNCGNILSVNVYNSSGQLVMRHTAPRSFFLEIDVKHLPRGFYAGVAKIEGGRTATFKFVK